MLTRKGFTLIELLLVIVILGLLATIGLSMMQRNSVSTKVDKTAQQMQILMQAATAYYVDNGCWPNNSISPPSTICPPSSQPKYTVTCNSGTPPSFDMYIPLGLNQAPWGQTYKCDPEPEKGKKFSVVVNDLPSSAVTAQLINKLPNAKYSPIQPNWVQAEIAAPLSTSDAGIFIAAIGTSGNLQNTQSFNANTGNINFSCPPYWTGGIVATPLSYSDMKDYSYETPWYYAHCVNNALSSSFVNLSSNLDCTSSTDNNNVTSYSCGSKAINFYSFRPDQFCKFVDSDTEIAIGSVNFFYMAWCAPPATNMAAPAPNNTPIMKLF